MTHMLKQQVEQRFGTLEKIQIDAEAKKLDQRFKKYGFFDNSSFSEGKKTIISRATIVNIRNLNNIQPVIPNQTSILGGDSIYNEFNEVILQLCKADKSAMDLRKIKIEKEFREKMGLIVNVPKPGQELMRI
ncbi:Hypothetical protein CINCED_3A013933 [Cinara cedri]|uniref:Uncharacterized protein n=2 Tax=Cinara cedri TaxID=506608 RepID=A0A5E4N2L7_9HEMI|nr:Hypothetical protein CINCED_3A013933 [Cinara cedri]